MVLGIITVSDSSTITAMPRGPTTAMPWFQSRHQSYNQPQTTLPPLHHTTPDYKDHNRLYRIFRRKKTTGSAQWYSENLPPASTKTCASNHQGCRRVTTTNSNSSPHPPRKSVTGKDIHLPRKQMRLAKSNRWLARTKSSTPTATTKPKPTPL